MPDKQDPFLLSKHVIRTLLYFNIFRYPLKSEEVYRFLGVNSVTQQDVFDELENLVSKDFIYRQENFYGLQKENDHALRRLRGNSLAKEFAPIALKQGRLISRFPFVRGVLASGSFSKDYMDENSDLDFFIITAAGRVWIVRALLAIYRRVFLANSHKLFCTNYFVDEEHLEIEEKNLFTATELATVIPLYSAQLYSSLITNNPWIKNFFPNFKPRAVTLAESQPSFIKRALEAVFNVVAIPLEKLLMWITFTRSKRIYARHYSADDFKVAFKTKQYASKNHPRNYQKKVIERYEQIIQEYSVKYDIKLER
jgi:hypothetical protein